jgi:hypothetical protein
MATETMALELAAQHPVIEPVSAAELRLSAETLRHIAISFARIAPCISFI